MTMKERLQSLFGLAVFLISTGLYFYSAVWTFTQDHAGSVAFGLVSMIIPPLGVINGLFQLFF